MPTVIIYKAKFCPYCVAAKRFLEGRKGVAVTEIDLSGDDQARIALAMKTGQRTVPQIFVGETHIGGYDELVAMDRAGNLDELLNG